MNNDFDVLIEFLARLGPEVSGRSASQPDDDAAATLLRFARGSCDEGERETICEMLRMHPAWIRWVADRIKLARPVKAQA